MSFISPPTAVLLKEHTSLYHQAVENVLLPRLQAVSSYEDYAAILKTFYGFYHPLQQQIAPFISANDLADISERRSASLILSDLSCLNIDIENIEQCCTLPTIKSKEQSFGALYVLEGSTLGGRTIMKMLQKNGNLQLTEKKLQFFNGYGEQTGKKWLSFLEALNRQPHTYRMIDTANKTFTLLKHWIKQTLYHEQHN